MNRVLAFLFFMLFLAGMAFLMLRNMQSMQDMNSDTQNISILSGEWRAGEQSVAFTADGRVTGNGGCNRFQGNYVATDKTVEIGPLAATRMACPQEIMDLESAFLAALQAVSSYSIAGRTLQLTTDDGQILELNLAPGEPEGE